jgi:hypothetical protein
MAVKDDRTELTDCLIRLNKKQLRRAVGLSSKAMENEIEEIKYSITLIEKAIRRMGGVL